MRHIQTRETCPGEDWKTYFTVILRVLGNCRYLLALIDTFSWWGEAFRRQMVGEVVKALLKEITPRFGFPGSLESDNG